MSILYITEQGATLRKRGNRLFVERQQMPSQEIPIFKISRIMLFGNINVTAQAMAMLLDAGIHLSFHSRSGRLRGVLSSTVSRNIFLRVAQQSRWCDQSYRLSFARNVVRAKVINQRAVIKRHLRNHPGRDLEQQVHQLENLIGQIENMQNLAEVMGVEGRASAVYFQAFAQMVRSEMVFPGRVRRPPTDPINALLSLGYVMLGNEIGALLEGMSFDPYLGFLHGLRYGRKSLAMDLLEEFRQPVVDLFTLNLVNLRVFQPKDFYIHGDGGQRLAENSFRHYLELFENRLREPFKDEITGRQVNWRQVVQRQLKTLEDAFLDDLEYQPYLKNKL
jgi:CRISPR-associated protein Cas1